MSTIAYHMDENGVFPPMKSFLAAESRGCSSTDGEHLLELAWTLVYATMPAPVLEKFLVSENLELLLYKTPPEEE